MPTSPPAITPFDRVLQGGDAVSRMLDPATRHGAALLNQMITQQAQIIAYNNDFRLMTLTVLPPMAAAAADAAARAAGADRGGGRGLIPADRQSDLLRAAIPNVMAGLDPTIFAGPIGSIGARSVGVGGRVKPGHDEAGVAARRVGYFGAWSELRSDTQIEQIVVLD